MENFIIFIGMSFHFGLVGKKIIREEKNRKYEVRAMLLICILLLFFDNAQIFISQLLNWGNLLSKILTVLLFLIFSYLGENYSRYL